jgi:hypothetical protein
MKFKLTLAIIALAVTAFAADNIYLAPNSIDATTHAPEAIRSANDSAGTGTLLVGVEGVQITPAFNVTATTYVPGTIVGGKLSILGVSNGAGGSATLNSILVRDSNVPTNKQPMQLLLFDTLSLTGTYTDNAALTVHASDVSHIIRSIPIAAADYINTTGTALAIADVAVTGKTLQLSGSTSMAGILFVTSGTATMTGTNTIGLKIGVSQN